MIQSADSLGYNFQARLGFVLLTIQSGSRTIPTLKCSGALSNSQCLRKCITKVAIWYLNWDADDDHSIVPMPSKRTPDVGEMQHHGVL
jgi:hypothetical protein